MDENRSVNKSTVLLMSDHKNKSSRVGDSYFNQTPYMNMVNRQIIAPRSTDIHRSKTSLDKSRESPMKIDDTLQMRQIPLMN